MDVYKILVVGDRDAQDDKKQSAGMTLDQNHKISQLQKIQSQVQKNKTVLSKHAQQQQAAQMTQKRGTISNSVMIDFVRIQLWEIAGNINVQNSGSLAFAPLFVRNAIGCIIVVNPSDPSSLLKAQLWKSKFDEATQLPDQNPFPVAVFVNHFNDEGQEIRSIQELANKQPSQLTNMKQVENLPHSQTSSQLFLNTRGDDSTTIRSPDTNQPRNLMRYKQQSPSSLGTRYLENKQENIKNIEMDSDDEFQFTEFQISHEQDYLLDKLNKEEGVLICHISAFSGQNLQQSFENFVEKVWNFSDKQRQQSNLLDDILIDNSYGFEANMTSESVLNTLGAERSRTTAHLPDPDLENEQFKTANQSEEEENKQQNRISTQIMNSQSPLARRRYRNGQNSLLQLPLQGHQSKYDRTSVRLEEKQNSRTKGKKKCGC